MWPTFSMIYVKKSAVEYLEHKM